MPLQTQLIDIPISGGIDTKSDPKQVQIGSNLKLENMVMQQTGQVSKRNGYTELGTETVLAEQDISAGYSIYDYDGSLVLWGKNTGNSTGAPDDTGFFTYASSIDKWKNVGSISPVEFSIDRISQSSEDILQSDMAVGAGYSVYFYKISGVARAEIFETGSETPFLFANTILPGTSPKIVFLSSVDDSGELFLGVGADAANNTLEKWTWDPDNPSDTTGATGSLDTDLHSDSIWDMARIEYGAGTAGAYEEAVIAFKNNSSGQISVIKVDATGTKIADVDLPVSPRGAIAVVPVINSAGTVHRILLFYQQAADWTLYCYSLDTDLVVASGPTQLTDDILGFAGTGKVVANITAAADFKENEREGEDCYRYWVETRETDGYNHTVYSGVTSLDAQNLSGLTITIKHHAGLAGKAFSFENSAYVLEVYDSDLQPTYFLTSMAYNAPTQDWLRIHAKILLNRAGPVQAGLSNAVKTATGNYSYSLLRRDRLLSDGVITYSVQAVNINMQPDAMPAVVINRNMYIGGGIITSFDNRAHELGYHLFPEKATPSISGTGGSISGPSLYSYVFVREWTDNQGSLHRSAPSSPLAVNVATSGLTHTISLNVGSLAYLGWGEYKTPTIYAYRTEHNGTNYYKIGDGGVVDDAADPDGIITITDTTSDANLIDNELLYTTGGVLETSSAPATKIISARKDRLFIVPMDDPFTIMFSKPVQSGVAAEFNEGLVSRIDVDGPNTALGILDDRVIVFKERSIYFFAGEGPNALGQGGFTPIRPVQTDVGCIDQKSVINIGSGIMFKSHKGIYMLDRSLQTSYIGAPVEEWNSYEIKSAVLVRDKNQVRFLMGSGQGVLVYDYFHRQWSRFTNYPGVDATMNNGKYTWVKTDGTVKQESTAYRDVNFVIPLKIRTPWIKLQSISGFQRVKRATIIGEFRSHHTLNVKIYTDYDDTNIQQEVNWVTTSNQQGDEPLQVEIHIKEQKCQSIMFEITDASASGTLESAKLSKITLDIGIKEGGNKLPERKTK
jgi:hypothetical protein